jgi:hypothetical protein
VGRGDFRADSRRRHDRRAAGVVFRQSGAERSVGADGSNHRQPSGERCGHEPNAIANRFSEADGDPEEKPFSVSF